jgi:phage shock protein PspC (stress-responsive transcriptional regulator)
MESHERTHSSDPSSRTTLGAHVTDNDIEHYLSRFEEDETGGFWNISTAAGLGLIAVGTAYIFQQLGFWDGVELDLLVAMLPWLAGILVILIGFGFLSHVPRPDGPSSDTSSTIPPDSEPSPRSRSSSSPSSTPHETAHQPSTTVNDLTIGQAAKNFLRAIRNTLREKRLVKSLDKKISGVCGGIATYFGIDPTLVRITFVVVTIFGSGAPILIYLGLVVAMPGPEEPIDRKTRVNVIRN